MSVLISKSREFEIIHPSTRNRAESILSLFRVVGTRNTVGGTRVSPEDAAICSTQHRTLKERFKLPELKEDSRGAVADRKRNFGDPLDVLFSISSYTTPPRLFELRLGTGLKSRTALRRVCTRP